VERRLHGHGFHMRKLTQPWSLAAALLLLAGSMAHSQIFSFGVKAGVPLTTVYSPQQIPDGGSNASEQRFTIGPTAEVHLPFHLSLEVDALWRQSSFSAIGAHLPVVLNSSVNDWQIPLLAKYEMLSGPVRPFIDGGVVFRHVSTNSSSVLPPTNPNTAGISVGGGLTLKLLHLRLSPEIRYTNWPTPAFSSAYTPVVSKSNQVDLLVGITW
jgi:hypothetical protein